MEITFGMVCFQTTSLEGIFEDVHSTDLLLSLLLRSCLVFFGGLFFCAFGVWWPACVAWLFPACCPALLRSSGWVGGWGVRAPSNSGMQLREGGGGLCVLWLIELIARWGRVTQRHGKLLCSTRPPFHVTASKSPVYVLGDCNVHFSGFVVMMTRVSVRAASK